MNITTTRLAAAVLTALVGGFLPPPASGAPHESVRGHHATPRSAPFSGTVDGVHTDRTPLAPTVVRDRFDLEGQASMLGRLVMVIESTVDFGSRPVTGLGTMTLTAANGDRLVADQTGSSVLAAPGTVLITEHAAIDPHRSTGRFAGAQGTFTLQRSADAATGVGGRTTGSFAGTIWWARPRPDGRADN